jgi:ribonuclease PH
MARSDGRANDQLRGISIDRDYLKHPEGSCLIKFGDTHVICTATVEDIVPDFLRNTQTGWITAEYGMLPRSCTTRVKRNQTSGRSQEIQRLIGRSLRSVVDMSLMGERTIRIDCDVLQADGGTRTASITGGFVAMALAFERLFKEGILMKMPLLDYVAAISVGIHEDELVLDLNYEEDSNAEMDMNVVMLGSGEFVEVQGTAEGKPFSKEKMDSLIEMARGGINQLFEIQRNSLGGLEI